MTMKRRVVRLLTLTAFFASSASQAAEPLRVHVAGGAAHALGPQGREFGAGGGGSAALELPLGGALGVQASAGGLALGSGERPADPGLAPSATGSAFTGTLGLRLRFFGAERVAGPWIDANGGVAQTGDLTRPAFDTHLGWDFRVSRTSNWDVGPFVGFTQIVQPQDQLRTDDARIAMIGIQVSLGAEEKARPAPPAREPDRDGDIEAFDVCPRDWLNGPPECKPVPPTAIQLVEEDDRERIQLRDLIHFEYDRARIRPESHGLVRALARFINDHPELLEVSIEGHADAIGSEEYNLQLSEARAESTRALLVRYGADATRLSVVGHGKSQPKIATQKADPRNRRVEFHVKRRREQANGNGTAAGTRGRR
jgi:outer membrane protein OmpA-like peptidoglycan-associated protein